MRSLFFGIVVGGVLFIISRFLNSTAIMVLLLCLGIAPILISGLLSGAFVSGDRVRANYTDSDDFSRRATIGSKLFLFGLPCLIAGIASYFV